MTSLNLRFPRFVPPPERRSTRAGTPRTGNCMCLSAGAKIHLIDERERERLVDVIGPMGLVGSANTCRASRSA